MSSELLKKIYIKCCSAELRINKPGNHSSFSKIIGMSEHKFRYAATISAKFLADPKLSLGESIYLASKNCKIILNSNYNLGIILLCAPLIKVTMNHKLNFKNNLTELLNSISKKDGKLIIKSITFVKPGGISNYEGSGNVFEFNEESNFLEIMKLGSKWDRISRCYINNYIEILDFGLPLLRSLKKKISMERAIENLYLGFLSSSLDSHIQRKHGYRKAKIVMKKSLEIQKKINIFRENKDLLTKLDLYLKKFHLNPGTCADLTVTTLLMDKIRDIFKIPL